MIPSQRRDLAWGIVDLDLLSQIPQEYARIIGRERGEGKLLQGQQWRRERKPRTKKKASAHEGEEDPLLKGSRICPLWAFTTLTGTSGGTQPTVRKLQCERLKTRAWPELPLAQQNF